MYIYQGKEVGNLEKLPFINKEKIRQSPTFTKPYNNPPDMKTQEGE